MQTDAEAGDANPGGRPPRRELANAIRALAMDAVQQANSGHPGMPMGMADIAEVLWNDALRHNPGNPHWPDRDRFVLSNGHGSMLHYALLHLTGYDLGIDDLRAFRQLHSRTAGHPEYRETPGIETTTGPLGQGFANAVGLALAERLLAAEFNRPQHTIVDHRTYVFVGDGCLMEGISHEAASLAGTLGLGKLVAVYDDNGISIDGHVAGWFTDDTPARFEAYGWHVIRDVDGHDAAAIATALAAARAETERPTLVCCRTIIGWGAPTKQGTESCHGAALGADEIARARERLGWPHAPFVVPPGIKSAWDARVRGAALERDWQLRFASYAAEHPQLAAEFERRVMRGHLPGDWSTRADAVVAETAARAETLASRKASQKAIEAYAALLPELLGGSADLSESNLTRWSKATTIARSNTGGNYLSYGVREFGMTAMLNGMALHGGYIPFGGTFLVFSDYARNAVRLAALMRIRVILVYTHDSIGLGEDGPTHQPVEHLASLRLIPNLHVWRPCDSTETAVAWRTAIERTDGPSALALSRQNLPAMPRDAAQIEAVRRGGYVLVDCAGTPEAIVIATGSEVGLAVDAAAKVAAGGRRIRVVSMPCTRIFDEQPDDYRESVLPVAVERRVVVEAGSSDAWWKYAGARGAVVGIDRFGASAPAGRLFEEFGLTAARVTAMIQGLLSR